MQKHQRGSVLGFVVVGALLAIAVVGGIYLVKNQLDGNLPSIPGGDEVAVVEDETEPVDEGTSSDEGQADESADAADDTQPNHTGDQPVEDRDDAVVEDETETEPSDDVATNDTEDQADIPQTGVETEEESANLPQTGVDVDQLPQTGLADGLYALVALGALTGSIVAFRRSNSL